MDTILNMKINHIINKNLALIIILFFYSIFLSLLLPARDWETDYGSYYSLSMFLDNENILYENMFSHSGPFYFFFIKILGYVVGWGWKSSIIVYAISYFLLFLSIFYCCKKLKIGFFETLIVLVLFTSYQKYFGSNVSLQIFFNINLVLFSLYLLLFITEEFKKKNLFLSIFFLSLLILTRIDGIIYSALFIFSYLYFLYIKKINLKLFFNDLIIGLLIFLIVFLFFKFYFGYSFKSYFDHNIIFNLKYGLLHDKLNNFSFILDLTPKKLTLSIIFFIITYFIIIFAKEKNKSKFTIPLIFLYIVLFLIYNFEIQINYYFFVNLILIILTLSLLILKDTRYIYLCYSTIFYLISIFILNYSGGYKLYYTAMLHPPYIFLFISVLILIKKINLNIYKYLAYFVFIFLIADQYKKHIFFFNSQVLESEKISFKNDINNFFYDDSLIKDSKIIVFQKKENVKVICGRGWLNVFSEKKTKGNLYDWWYFAYILFDTEYFNNDYEYFIKGNLGNFFLIDKGCLKPSIKSSDKLKYIIKNSVPNKEFNFFNNTYELRRLLQ